MPNISTLPSIRQALLLDAAVSGAAGLVMLVGAPLAETWLGMPEALLHFAGVLLLPYAAFVALVAGTERPSRPAVRVVIGCNALWVAGSALLLVAAGLSPTALGYIFVLAQAAVVAFFAELQFAGLRRSAALPA